MTDAIRTAFDRERRVKEERHAEPAKGERLTLERKP